MMETCLRNNLLENLPESKPKNVVFFSLFEIFYLVSCPKAFIKLAWKGKFLEFTANMILGN